MMLQIYHKKFLANLDLHITIAGSGSAVVSLAQLNVLTQEVQNNSTSAQVV